MAIDHESIIVKGISIQCFYAGQGNDTILFLHGAGVDSAMMSWSEVMLLLAKDYKVIAPDLPGYGGSDRINGDYTLEFYTEIVKGVVEAFRCPPVILAGLSLGGGICFNMALTYPELIKLLVPVDAWGVFPRLPYHRLTHWYTRSKINDNLYQWIGKYRSIIRWSLENSLIGNKRKITDALVDEVQKSMLKPDAGKPFISFQRSEITRTGLKTDLFYRLSAISIPTLLVHGSRDKAVPLKDAIVASKIIPNCKLYIMEGCKHWPQKERPKEFSRVVGEFIEEHNMSGIRKS